MGKGKEKIGKKLKLKAATTTNAQLECLIRDLENKLDQCGHTLWEILECKDSRLCDDCEKMAKTAITLTGWGK